jgi:hypothetical protein
LMITVLPPKHVINEIKEFDEEIEETTISR